MIKLIDLIKENSANIYDYGCVMLYFKFPELFKIQDAINPKYIYKGDEDKTFGMEDEPHTTLLYGLHKEVSLNDIKEVLNNFTFSTCKINNISLFNNPKYDVLKFEVSGKNLKQCNKALKEFPYTSNFPKYNPHLTIGYLHPGTGQQYVDKFKDIEFELVPLHAIYSQPDGTKSKIKINID
jgi:2'-5' RNA ligase